MLFLIFKASIFLDLTGIAQGVQKIAEYKILKWIKYWIRKTKIKNISYSGGVSMNVKVNKDISNLKQVSKMRVNGSGSDETLSIGACFAYMIKNKLNYKPLTNLYLGFKESEEQISKNLKN